MLALFILHEIEVQTVKRVVNMQMIEREEFMECR